MRGREQQLDDTAAIMAAAHELKSPLTLIAYISQMLTDTTLNLSDTEKVRYAERLRAVSGRTLRLVQQLTRSYRIADLDPQLEPVNTTEVCEAALHELTPIAHEYNQQLKLITHACPHVAIANRDILYDVVINLVDNAIRHNVGGGVVHVAAQCRSQRVRLTVHDNGAGILPRELSQLRRLLGRAPQPLNNHSGSSGLGLYIASQLTGAMGGRLGLGRADVGTTFFVDLLRSQQLSLW